VNKPEYSTSSSRRAIYDALRTHNRHYVPVKIGIQFASIYSDAFAATTPKWASIHSAPRVRQAVEDAAVRRKIEEKARGYIRDHLAETVRRASKGTVRLRF
jgi:hypothetical protein